MAEPRAILTVNNKEHTVSFEIAVNQIQIPINQAAQITDLDAAILRHLVRAGVLAGAATPQADICNLDAATAIAGKLDEARKPVEGVGILATAAAEKYGFARKSIYRWYQNNWIKLLEIDQSDHQIFNEGDIAFARALADIIGHAAGKAVFPAKPRSGRPRKDK